MSSEASQTDALSISPKPTDTGSNASERHPEVIALFMVSLGTSYNGSSGTARYFWLFHFSVGPILLSQALFAKF